MNENILKYFKEISSIPRETYHIDNISNYLVDFAKKNKLEVYQDEVKNVIIKKEASNGYEEKDPIIIQAHMDMVCQKTNDSSHDFAIDKVEIIEEDGYLKANNTTLGADNGIGMAIILTVLESNLKHPKIEAVFTVDEEVGMEGANNLDFTKLESSRLINVDSEDEGILTAGCAGGVRVEVEYKANQITKRGYLYTLSISNLRGGHSGVDIDKKHVNAITYMSKILNDINNYYLVSINGGKVDNAICDYCEVELLFEKEYDFNKLIDKIEKELKELGEIDSIVNLTSSEEELKVFDQNSTKDIINYLTNNKDGVISYEEDLPELVKTSLNIGIVETNNNLIIIHHSIRSSNDQEKNEIVQMIKENAKSIGAKVDLKNSYSGWKYNENSPLRKIFQKIYKEMFNKELIIDVVHAGLECGIFVGKKKDLDCISIGPTIIGAHTPKEKVEIASVNKIYDYIIKVLENL